MRGMHAKAVLEGRVYAHSAILDGTKAQAHLRAVTTP